MKQSVTRDLFAYWDALRGDRPAPDRNDIEPGAIRGCLADTFILAVEPEGGHPFQLAGTAVCAIFDRELTGVPFAGLWAEAHLPAISNLVRNLADETVGAVAGIVGRTGEGDTVELEMILLPLTGTSSSTGRLLGGVSPVRVPYWLGARAVRGLELGDLRYLGSPTDIARKFVAGSDNPLPAQSFVVYAASLAHFTKLSGLTGR
jgi:hypothetical protein